jgi:molecular chaperone HscB
MSRTLAAAVNPSPSSSSSRPSGAEGDLFAVLGVPPRFEIDRDALERTYLERAAAVHPDRFVGGTSSQRREAMERSALVNEAYRTLRDPVLRAEYLVKLGGIDLDSSDPVSGAPPMDETFLVDMIERRELVDQARAEGTLERLRARVEDELEDAFDDAVALLRGGDVQAAARGLVVRRYLQRLLDEIDS